MKTEHPSSPSLAAPPRPVGVAQSAPYLRELESARGIAILLVVLFHVDSFVLGQRVRAAGIEATVLTAFVRSGHSGVTMFFVLSSFLLSLPFWRAADGGRPVSMRTYFARRALRILPLYWTAVAVAGVLSAAHPADVRHALPYLFFLNSFPEVAKPLPPYSNVWWSLATEVQFYFLLPLLPLCLASRARRVAGALGMAVYLGAYAAFELGVLQAGSVAGQLKLGHSVFGRGPIFLCGIAAAWFFCRYGDAVRRRLAAAPWARWGGADLALLAALLGLAYLLRWVAVLGYDAAEPVPYHAWHTAEGALWTSIVLLILLAPLRVKPLLVNRALDRLGVLSYSIYLVHVPLTILVLHGVARAGVTGIARYYWYTYLVIAGVCGICVALSEVTYRLVERPFLLRKEHLRT